MESRGEGATFHSEGVLNALNIAQEGQDLLSIDSSICPL
jgi:hypothetical protein